LDHHSDFVVFSVGENVRRVIRGNELPSGNCATRGALTATAGEDTHQAGGPAARRRGEMIVAEVDRPVALADWQAGQRHAVARVELALRETTVLIPISHHHCKRGRTSENCATTAAI